MRKVLIGVLSGLFLLGGCGEDGTVEESSSSQESIQEEVKTEPEALTLPPENRPDEYTSDYDFDERLLLYLESLDESSKKLMSEYEQAVIDQEYLYSQEFAIQMDNIAYELNGSLKGLRKSPLVRHKARVEALEELTLVTAKYAEAAMLFSEGSIEKDEETFMWGADRLNQAKSMGLNLKEKLDEAYN